jgi:phenylalanyl-tRNA synthetase beta chain
LADELPPQLGNPRLEKEEQVREQLKSLGLQEVVNYRLTSIEREARLSPDTAGRSENPYVHLANPIASDRDVLRRSLLSSVMEVVERNSRIREHLALFEIGPVFIPDGKENLPEELVRLAVVLTGSKSPGSWEQEAGPPLDFFDLKGIVSELLAGLRIEGVGFVKAELPECHPGKCAVVEVDGIKLGYIGELHPLSHEQFDLSDFPVQAAEFDLDAMLEFIPSSFEVKPVPVYPPVLEDLAIIVDEEIPAERVLEVLEKAGGMMLVDIRLFDVYRGKQIGAGKKSLAYSLSYQAQDRTLTDEEVAKIRNRIVRRLEKELNAKLRS